MRESGVRYTFRANETAGRHGWLRLTPAYSVGLVRELVAGLGLDDRVLDPFCGTGTTALVCAELGIPSLTLDINPFLVWLARTKCAVYTPAEIDSAMELIERAARAEPATSDWRPPLANIERWWDEPVLAQLAAAWSVIRASMVGTKARDLGMIAFCRTLIAVSKASYGHQSVSFSKDISPHSESIAPVLIAAGEAIAERARQPVRGGAEVVRGDARDLRPFMGPRRVTAVVTSPPYPNRMSYVRELRPYLYWLGFLADGRAAGDLDWAAIGGTWGIATSRLKGWRGSGLGSELIDSTAIATIRARSPLLANYVLKYVEDMAGHFSGLREVMKPGGRATYIIGNSHFYGVPVETQEIFAELYRRAGFGQIGIETLRKRTSKTGLFEYAVSAVAPS